jgi:hypothetical protein
MFLAAKRALRANPRLTDDELAEVARIPRALIPSVVPQARRELENDGVEPWMAGPGFSQTAETRG